MNEKQRVAIHEAGHAVAACLMGKHYGCALHANGGGIAGTGDLSEPAVIENYTAEKLALVYAETDIQVLLADAVVTAAGGVAEALARCEFHVHVSSGDRRLLTASCRRAFPVHGGLNDVDNAWANLAVTRARALLFDQLCAVEAVAVALGERGCLTAGEVAGLVAQRKEMSI